MFLKEKLIEVMKFCILMSICFVSLLGLLNNVVLQLTVVGFVLQTGPSGY